MTCEEPAGAGAQDDRRVSLQIDRRNAHRYLVGLGFSLIGNSALSLVAGIWVKTLTGSSAAAGLVSACIYAPSLVGPLAGMLADRVRRQPWLIWINLVSAVVVATLLAVSSRDQLWLIYAVMTFYGLSLVLIDPAEKALFAQMLPLPLRRKLNGWRLGLQETGRLVAPLLGAGMFVVLGGPAVAALDAGTFVIAAVMVAGLRLPREPAPLPRQPWRHEIIAGFAHIRGTRQLTPLVTVGTIIMAVSAVGVAAQYSMVTDLGQPPSFLGVLTAALGGGSVAASLLSSRVMHQTSETTLAMLGLVAFTAGTLLRTTGNMPAAVAGSLTLGFALPWVFLAVLSATQNMTPHHLQGRVSAAVTLLLFGPQAPLQALGSFAIAHINYRVIYVATAAAAALLAIWLRITSSHHTSPEPSLDADR